MAAGHAAAREYCLEAGAQRWAPRLSPPAGPAGSWYHWWPPATCRAHKGWLTILRSQVKEVEETKVYSLTNPIGSDTQVLEKNVPLSKAKMMQMRGICARVDRLEDVIKMVGHHVCPLPGTPSASGRAGPRGLLLGSVRVAGSTGLPPAGANWTLAVRQRTGPRCAGPEAPCWGLRAGDAHTHSGTAVLWPAWPPITDIRKWNRGAAWVFSFFFYYCQFVFWIVSLHEPVGFGEAVGTHGGWCLR